MDKKSPPRPGATELERIVEGIKTIELVCGIVVSFYETANREQRVAIEAGKQELNLPIDEFLELLSHPEVFTEAVRRSELPWPVRLN